VDEIGVKVLEERRARFCLNDSDNLLGVSEVAKNCWDPACYS
jgi:hypothetical protein